MFGWFDKIKKEKAVMKVGSPVAGEAVSLAEVSDPVFSQEVLGKGVAIRPVSGQVRAPEDGVISAVFETGHAFSMTTREGIEILVHVGLDTVQLKGEHFQIHRRDGEEVRKGDLILSANLEAIQAAGYDTVTLLVVCNSDAYTSVDAREGQVGEGDVVLEVRR